MNDLFSRWVSENAIRLNYLTPDDDFEDLNPLKEIIGNSKVVALGENSHFIKEFCLFRHRLIKFLIEKCNFTVFAMEFGFSEGFEINDWIHQKGEESELLNLLNHFPYPKEIYDTFKWMRKYNSKNNNSINFTGIDIPRNGGSLFPSIEIIKHFIEEADKDSLPLVLEIYDIAKKINGLSTAQSVFLLNKISTDEQYKLTALLSKLLLRFKGMEINHINKYGQNVYNTIYQHIESILYLDYNSHAMNNFITGKGLSFDMGIRDKFMADSVIRCLKSCNENDKIILVAHNAHIQKVPVKFGDFSASITMGQNLANKLGENYISFGITSLKGNTAALYPDENYKYGFKIEKTSLSEPDINSIEHYFYKTNISHGFINFKNIPKNSEIPQKIRFDSEYLELSVIEAFDGLFQIPESNISDEI